MITHTLTASSYAALLHPAAGVGTASIWTVPAGPDGYEPYLVLPYRVGAETFHRVWAYDREVAGEASYVFLGDTSVSLPGVVAPGLHRIAASARQLTAATASAPA
ncbi:hypothetical protein [Microbacterium hydrocarbonoxydans]|uniref:hypothetical protein n=1 Tax=Microbacterium hydrocarbonoxydans TaxID=273678 RepID=UPI0013DB0162|nr:hypothetical protein [Microbacterium hydrocarbonoxydans]